MRLRSGAIHMLRLIVSEGRNDDRAISYQQPRTTGLYGDRDPDTRAMSKSSAAASKGRSAMIAAVRKVSKAISSLEITVGGPGRCHNKRTPRGPQIDTH